MDVPVNNIPKLTSIIYLAVELVDIMSLVILEGIDGTGKTTLSKLVAEDFGARWLREPTRMSEASKLLTENIYGKYGKKETLLLFLEDRIQNVRKNILPLLSQHKLIIQDRYYHSTAVYQGKCTEGCKTIFQICQILFPAPDLTIILELEPRKIVERLKNRDITDDNLKESLKTFQTRIERYRYLRKLSNGRIVYLNADQPLEVLRKEIKKIIRGHDYGK